LFGSCVMISTHVAPLDKDKVAQDGGYMIKKPVKAHLHDGSVVVYENGFVAVNDTIRTSGIKYNLTRDDSLIIQMLPTSEVAEYEYYRKFWHADTFLLTLTGDAFYIILFYALKAASAGISSMGA